MTEIVGILNVTPDSFSDGNLYFKPEFAVKHAKNLFKQGASIVDIGAESTRPGATKLTSEEEWQRLEEILAELAKFFPASKFSIDTHNPDTAEKVLMKGNYIINDVTGMNNPNMVSVILRHKAKCIISHLPGSDIQRVHEEAFVNDIQRVVDDLLKKAKELEAGGIKKEDIILDPGIGFGKTTELNMKLLSFAKYISGYRVMIGFSRKRFLGEDRMRIEPNIEAAKIAINSGAAYIRVHEVEPYLPLLKNS
ncbi:MAG: dihydropteroate synthase [Candidatus Saccharimonadales bacterium]